MKGLIIQVVLPESGEGTFRVELGPAEPDVGIFNAYLDEWEAIGADGRVLSPQPDLSDRDIDHLEEHALEAKDWT